MVWLSLHSGGSVSCSTIWGTSCFGISLHKCMCLCCTDRSTSAQCIQYLLIAAQLLQETTSMTLGSSICEGKPVDLSVSSRMCTVCYHCLHCTVLICQRQGIWPQEIPASPFCLPPPQVLLPPTAGHPITGVSTTVGQHYEMMTGFRQKQRRKKKKESSGWELLLLPSLLKLMYHEVMAPGKTQQWLMTQ